MSNLIVLGFDNEAKAFEMRAKLSAMQKDYLLEMEDIVIVTKNEKGKVKMHQAVSLTAHGAIGGTFWGMLMGTLLGLPLIGAAVGAGTGALSGALSDIGIDDQFMKELAKAFQPNSSALFVLVRKSTPDKVLEGLKGFAGSATILKTSLSVDEESKLREILEASEG